LVGNGGFPVFVVLGFPYRVVCDEVPANSGTVNQGRGQDSVIFWGYPGLLKTIAAKEIGVAYGS